VPRTNSRKLSGEFTFQEAILASRTIEPPELMSVLRLHETKSK
jgi:hypothetical protein